MNIREMEPEDLETVVRFNERIFPERRDIARRFKYHLQENPFQVSGKPTAVLAFDGNELVGQMLMTRSEYLVQGETKPCYFSFDFYAVEQYRALGIGGLLAAVAVRRFHPFFTIGVSEEAKRVLVALHIKTIGELHKYIWLRRSVKTAFSIFRRCIAGPLPWGDRSLSHLVLSSKDHFRRDIFPETEGVEGSDGTLLAFTRCAKFLRWRFVNHPNGYAMFTLACATSTFLVVRMLVWRGLRVLRLVDYRYPHSRPDLLRRILECSKTLAKAVGADGVFAMSSRADVDQTLRRSGFLRVGKPCLIMSNAPNMLNRDRMLARNAVFATMADSDLDFN